MNLSPSSLPDKSMAPGGGKKTFRRRFAAGRKRLPELLRREYSASVVQHLLAWSEAHPEITVWGGYVSDGVEVDLMAFFRAKQQLGHRLFFPRFVAENACYTMVEIHDFTRDFVTGRYGILEPGQDLPVPDAAWAAERICYLVPGVAFDKYGNRIGRGKGYYDRLLAAAQGCLIGVGFQLQCADRPLPCEAHDRKLDWIVTEAGIHSTS